MSVFVFKHKNSDLECFARIVDTSRTVGEAMAALARSGRIDDIIPRGKCTFENDEQVDVSCVVLADISPETVIIFE